MNGPRDPNCLNFPAVLHHRTDDSIETVAAGPLVLLAETLLCFPPAERNAFSIRFAFPSGAEESK